MKILYVRNNNFRKKEFHIQTIIYEKRGKKFVKKLALSEAAIAHLNEIKKNYYKLKSIIINPNVKLAEILEENDNSVTFEYIEGESLAQKLYKVQELGEKDKKEFFEEFKNFLINSFKIKKGVNLSKNKNILEQVFGEIDYSIFDNEICFEKYTNIDLIFTNIICNNKKMFIIDYEWVFDVELPVGFIIYRAYRFSKLKEIIPFKNIKLFEKMENNFSNYVYDSSSFFKYKMRYLKNCYYTPLSTNYFFQIFLKYNGVYDESFSFKKGVQLGAQKIKFIIPDFFNSDEIRIDPINSYSIVKINSIKGNNQNLEIIRTNAFIVDGNTFYFDSKDPQIYISTKGMFIRELEIDFELLAIAEKALEEMLALLKRIIR